MPMVPEILYEDNHLVAVNKRCGDITQGDKTGDTPLGDSVKSFIKEKYNKPGNVFLGLIHRLDRPTSGIILFARTSKALARMNDMFKMEGLVQKTYWAVVDNKPDAETATLEHWLVRDEKQNKSFESQRKIAIYIDARTLLPHANSGAVSSEEYSVILFRHVIQTIINAFTINVREIFGRSHLIPTRSDPLDTDAQAELARASEKGDVDHLAEQVALLGLSAAQFNRAQLQALAFAETMAL